MKRLLLGLLLAAVGTAAAGERSVSLERDFGILRGTLTEPADGAETAVLLIAGSGPTDRNCNSGLGLRTNSFQYLAEELEKAGIASLRYDKRGIGASAFDHPEKMAEVVFEDFIADASAWADYLAAQGYRKIVLLGHSEGALIALCAAQRDPRITAVVSASGPGCPFDELLKKQLSQQLPASEMGLYIRAEGILAALKRGERVADIPPPLAALFHPSVQPFVISILRYDPREVIRGVEIPVLIIQGDNDLQIGTDNADALSKAQPKARKVIVPGMTHPLKKSAYSTLQGQMTTVYANPDLPLDPDFAKAVIAFVSSPEFRRAA